MSVSFQKETVRGTAPAAPLTGAPLTGGRDGGTAHKIGEALTGGKGQTGYLEVSCTNASRQGQCADS